METALTKRYGGRWVARGWNPRTESASIVYGSTVQFSPSRLATDEGAEATARLLAAENPEVFSTQDLRLASIKRFGGKTAVHFRQELNGLEVVGGRAYFVFGPEGMLMVMGAELFDTSSTVDGLLARGAAEDAVTSLTGRSRITFTGSELVWLPTETDADGLRLEKCWAASHEGGFPLPQTSYVSARSGVIFYTDVHGGFADFDGEVTADFMPQCGDDIDPVVLDPFDPIWQNSTDLPIQYLNVLFNGTDVVQTGTDGTWAASAATSTADVDITLDGAVASVVLDAGGPGINYHATATDTVTLETDLSPPVGTRPELVAYAAIHNLKTIFEDIDPNFSLVDGSDPIDVTVESDSCESGVLAQAGTTSIMFCEAPVGWNSPATVAFIVYHELGHTVAGRCGHHGAENGLREGVADMFASQVLNEPRTNRGAKPDCTYSPRRLDVRKSFPDDYCEDCSDCSIADCSDYEIGRIIGSYYWFLGEAFRGIESAFDARARVLKLFYAGGILLEPATYEQEALAVFIADDTDGNLLNGTPFYDLIYCEAACHFPLSFLPEKMGGNPTCPAGHCDPAPVAGPQVDHIALGTTTSSASRLVSATVHPTSTPVEEGEVYLVYRIGDADPVVAQMEHLGSERYVGELPATQAPSDVSYYIYAEDIHGRKGTSPENAPLDLHTFAVANLLFDFEGEPAWFVDVDGTDTAQDGQWVQADPVGTTAQPEDDVTVAPGTRCWVTGNGMPGADPAESDLDGGATSLTTTELDFTGAATAEMRFHWWFSGPEDPADRLVLEAHTVERGWFELIEFADVPLAWVDESIDLSEHVAGSTGPVSFRFVAVDGADDSVVEAAIDNVAFLVSYDATSSALPESGPISEYLSVASPNPTRGPVEFRFGLNEGHPVTLEIYDVHGRRVRRVMDRTATSGHHTEFWDGTDDQGRPVGSGVYFARLGAASVTTTRVVVMR